MTSDDRTFRIENLHAARGGKPVLHGISVTIAPGEVVALLGPNGAGKSTTVMCSVGLVPVTQGRISIGGHDVTNKEPHEIRRSGVCAVLEGHKVLTSLTVRENLASAASMLPAAEVPAAIDRVLEIFPGLKPKIASRAGDLSGGQQQMVSVAQAIMGDPKVLLADELSFGLAPVIVNSFVPVLERLAEQGVGILLIEQYTHLALKLANRVAVLDRGRIALEDTAQVFIDNPDLIHEAYLVT
jgi:branched-chain amino acid transport system ATP-binding protein